MSNTFSDLNVSLRKKSSPLEYAVGALIAERKRKKGLQIE
jgi:hypothetical protein